MEMMDRSLHDLYKLVYNVLKQKIPEEVVGKMAESVRGREWVWSPCVLV